MLRITLTVALLALSLPAQRHTQVKSLAAQGLITPASTSATTLKGGAVTIYPREGVAVTVDEFWYYTQLATQVLRQSGSLEVAEEQAMLMLARAKTPGPDALTHIQGLWYVTPLSTLTGTPLDLDKDWVHYGSLLDVAECEAIGCPSWSWVNTLATLCPIDYTFTDMTTGTCWCDENDICETYTPCHIYLEVEVVVPETAILNLCECEGVGPPECEWNGTLRVIKDDAFECGGSGTYVWEFRETNCLGSLLCQVVVWAGCQSCSGLSCEGG